MDFIAFAIVVDKIGVDGRSRVLTGFWLLIYKPDLFAFREDFVTLSAESTNPPRSLKPNQNYTA